MESQLMQIQAKPSDYKVCINCKKINWHENENCIECESNGFNEEKSYVLESLNDEYIFYTKEFNNFENGLPLTEREADYILIEI